MQLNNNVNIDQKFNLAETNVIPEYIPFKGRVLVTYEDDDGSTGVLHFKDNIIVNVARDTVCRLLTEPQTTKHITTFKIGQNGHSGGDILTPEQPTIEDSKLRDSSPFSKTINSFSLLPNEQDLKNQIDFNITLEKTEANASGSQGRAYTEAGLFTQDDKLFARETFPAIIKTPSRRISFVWSILL